MLLVFHCQTVKFTTDNVISFGYRKLQSRWDGYW